MTLMMEIKCGTLRAKKFEINLDHYGIRDEKVVYGPDQKVAYDLLRSTLNDVTFADDHCRNEDAVNSLIALHVLGYDAEEWMKYFLGDMESRPALFHSCDIEKFREHVDRVVPYLDHWGPEEDKKAALGYVID